MRLIARGTSARPPRRVFMDLAEPRDWDRILHYPDGVPIRRVKLLDTSTPAVGTAFQVLFEDLGWTRHRITAWQPDKRIEFIAEAEGSGEADGRAPAIAWSERLLLIPQGAGAEIEWSVRFHTGALTRLVAPLAVSKEAWKAALEARVTASR